VHPAFKHWLFIRLLRSKC